MLLKVLNFKGEKIMEDRKGTKEVHKVNYKNIGKRIFIYVLGLFIIALGVSVSVKSNLGISPVNSIPYVVSLITGVEQGKCVTVIFCIFIGLQALILLKDFKMKNLLQIICSTIFGYFVTTANKITAGMPVCSNYGMQLLYLFVSMCLIAVGLFLFIRANLIGMPAEGLAGAIVQRFGVKFPNAKTGCDVAMVLVATGLSLIYFHELRGVREGTILAAIFIGQLMKIWNRYMGDRLTKFIEA